jgi:hypothetical protein
VITASTNEHGEFWFVGLHPGPYEVQEVVSQLPAGVVPTTPTSVTLVAGDGPWGPPWSRHVA